MAKTVKIPIGRMKCETRTCNHLVMVMKNDKGTLSYSCDECQGNAYVHDHQVKYKTWIDDVNSSSTTALDTHQKPATPAARHPLQKPPPLDTPPKPTPPEVKSEVKKDIWGNPL